MLVLPQALCVPILFSWNSSPDRLRRHRWLEQKLSRSYESTTGCITEQLHACLVFQWYRLFVTPWTVACQASLSMGFPRQEYWSGLPFPPPGNSCVFCIGRWILYHCVTWEAPTEKLIDVISSPLIRVNTPSLCCPIERFPGDCSWSPERQKRRGEGEESLSSFLKGLDLGKGLWITQWQKGVEILAFGRKRGELPPTPVFLPGESRGRTAWWATVRRVTQSLT